MTEYLALWNGARLDNENLIDNDGRRILMDNLTGYKNELYRDPLTGVTTDVITKIILKI